MNRLKNLYNIEIKETISDVVEIEADSIEEAQIKAEEGYYNGTYILDGIDPQEREVTFKNANEGIELTEKRKNEIINNLLDYVREHCVSEDDYYNALVNIIRVSNYEMLKLGIDINIEISEKEPLSEDEIMFEDEIIIEGKSLNLYIPLYNINIFEKFEIEEIEGYEYDLFLDYNIDLDRCTLSIIEKDDEVYKEYKYVPSKEENAMLREKINQYCIEKESKSLEEIIDDEIERDD